MLMDTNGHMFLSEDYVSFEVAKLLKEKGFDEPCRTYYRENKLINDVCVNYNQWNSKSPFGFISAPTHQMAMKWLREKHLYIEIRRSINTFLFGAIIIRDGKESFNKIGNLYDSYEEVVETALKYSLEKLI